MWRFREVTNNSNQPDSTAIEYRAKPGNILDEYGSLITVLPVNTFNCSIDAKISATCRQNLVCRMVGSHMSQFPGPIAEYRIPSEEIFANNFQKFRILLDFGILNRPISRKKCCGMVFSGEGDDMSEATEVFASLATDAPNSIATHARDANRKSSIAAALSPRRGVAELCNGRKECSGK